MAKLTKAAVQEKLEEWAAKEIEAQRAAKSLELAQAPILEECELKLAEVSEKYERKIAKATIAANDLAGEIEAWLESQPKAVKVETARAIAELQISTTTKAGPRVVDAQAFIKKAESQKKDPWSCIKVEVMKAEKLLGPKDIDTVSTRKETSTESRNALIALK